MLFPRVYVCLCRCLPSLEEKKKKLTDIHETYYDNQIRKHGRHAYFIEAKATYNHVCWTQN